MGKQKESLSIEKTIAKNYGDNILVSGHSLLEKNNIIIPVSPKIDLILGGGIPEGSMVIFTGQPKWGKANHLDSIIFTPSGPTRFGDIKVGDLVCIPTNETSKVINIFPQGKQDIYKIIFNNRDSCECTLDHLWEVRHRNMKFHVLTLQQILNSGLFLHDNKRKRPKWSIITSVCRFDPQPIEIDPYILGLLLGDGGLKHNRVQFSSIDQELIQTVNKYLQKFNYILKKYGKNNVCTYSICTNKQPNHIIQILKKYGLYGTTSHTKFIPPEFKYNTLHVRYEILRGLLDTDGHIGKNGSIEFSSTSHQLINDVKEIVLSLGGITEIRGRATSCNGKCFPSYRCVIKFVDQAKLFKLSRKLKRCKYRKKPLLRKIVDVQYIGQKECQCIQIDHPRGLYVIDNYIATHNTTMALTLAATCQKPEYGGEFCPEGRDIYYYNVEGRLKRRDLIGIPNLNLDKFHIIESTPGKILRGEEYLQIADTLINSKIGAVHIIDSYSALCTEAELTAGMDQMQRADGAKLLSKFCRKVSNVIPVNKSIVIGVTHQMANPTGYGKAFKEKSGQSIAYQVDVKLQAVAMRPWKDKNEIQIGQEVDWQCLTSAIGPPGKTTTSYIRYGEGIDKIQELSTLALDLGLIQQSGSWCKFLFIDPENPPSVQGIDNIKPKLLENPEWLELLRAKIKELL